MSYEFIDLRIVEILDHTDWCLVASKGIENILITAHTFYPITIYNLTPKCKR